MVKVILWLIIIALGAILASPLLVSRIQTDGSMLINGAGDNLWHLSLASEVQKQYPPSFPGMSGIPLKNYHFFSDAIWGLISKWTGVPIPVIYFQVASLVVCSILVYLIFRLAKTYSLSDFWAIICVFTSLFIGSAAFIKPLLLPGSSWSGNNFMLDTPYSQLINVHTGVGYLLVILGTLFVIDWIKTNSLKSGIVASLVISILFGFKTFFALPMAISFGIFCLFQAKNKGLKNILPVIVMSLLSFMIFLSVSDRTGVSKNAPISLRPGWLLTKMIEDTERFNIGDLYLRQLHYEKASNLPRLIQIELQKLTMFIFGNFWIKLLGVVFLIIRHAKQKKEDAFLFLTIVISVIMSLVAVPHPDPFNAVQFGQVGVIFSGFALGLFIANSSKKVLFLLLIPLLLYSLKSDFFNHRNFNEYLIPSEEVSALQFLKTNSNQEAIVMVDPRFDNKKMKVSGIAERRTFYSGGIIPWLLGIDDTDRANIQKDFFSQQPKLEIQKVISEYSIDYIYSSTPNENFSNTYPLVYSNTKVYLYQTTQR